MSKRRELQVTSAVAYTAAGEVAARVDLVQVGGGVQTVTVDGQPEDRVHELRELYHVRFISPDRMIPDEVREAPDYATAASLAMAYGLKRDQHAAAVSELAGKLAVD